MTVPGAAATLCANCEARLAGPWCHACGQHAGGTHRSVRHLAGEFVETFTHADSRLWRTLRRLAIAPAALTRDYLGGHRVSQIPPLRLLLVVLFVLFGLGVTGGDLVHVGLRDEHGRAMTVVLHEKIAHLSLGAHEDAASWLRGRLSRALDDPGAFVAVTGEWAERFALLLLPVAAVVMRALTLRRRDCTLFDHFIFVMHSMSATALVLIAVDLLSRVGLDAVSSWLLLILPFHLFIHMKGTYGFGVTGTLLRMMMLGLATSFAILVLVSALAGFGLYTLRG